MIRSQFTYAVKKFPSKQVLPIVAAGFLLWWTARICQSFAANRSTAALILWLEVLGIATRGDWILALWSSSIASLAFSFYFIDEIDSFRITTSQGLITFCVMAVTAFTGSRLSIIARRRAEEAIRRREDMDRLNQLGRILLSANTLSEAAGVVVRKVVELFGLNGAVLRIAGESDVFQSGAILQGPVSMIPLDTEHKNDFLELHGAPPSEEVRNAMASMIRLVLERARSAEARAQLEAIRKGEELHNTVLNAMAHNLKTPLTSIKAAASMLRVYGAFRGKPEGDLVAVIDEEADRLNQLIMESLDLAKFESRRINPLSENCLLQDIAGRVAVRMSRYFGRREFIIDLPEGMPAIRGDSFLFEQMLVQVVDNAWKYSQPGAPIRISGEMGFNSVILTVWNGGSEIPEDERDRIFDRFFRGSRDRHRVEGSGLGLARAKTIAEACGGKMWLDIEPLGPAFRFELPLEKAGRGTGSLDDRKLHNLIS
ncbi:MAG: ATP-binding protein [Acidobacteriota bacterium]|nr:ATP-binding protein [Acidobacteriota bacterium]